MAPLACFETKWNVFQLKEEKRADHRVIWPEKFQNGGGIIIFL